MTPDQLTPILTDARDIRARIHARAVEALRDTFPLDLRGRTLEAHDIVVDAKDFSPERQKREQLTGGSLMEPVRATLVLKDKDGRELDRAPNFTLAHLPFFSERHTVLMDGNEYQVANMLRRKSGAYTERSENGELSTFFNLSRGRNFSLVMNPEKGTLYMNYGTSNIPLYPVLRAIGVPPADIARHLGVGVAAQNERAYGNKVGVAVDKLYAKMVMPGAPPVTSHEGKVDYIRARLDATAMDPEVNAATLGMPHAKVTSGALLDGARRLLDAYQGKKDPDDADSLAYKTFHSIDDFLAERIRLSARTWKLKARQSLQGKDTIRGGLRAAPFSDSIRKFVTTSPLTAVPTAINPIELLDHSTKVTSLGEGGIPSERAIPYEARMTHPTHYGTLDPIRTPESGHAGVDIRASIAAQRDDRGNLYTLVRDRHGEVVPLKAGDVLKHTIAFPHQELKGDVAVMVKGVTQMVPAHQADYQFIHEAHALSPATSLLPMLRGIQGNRAIMASKMQTQALPLIEREAPYLQVKSHLDDGSSFERVYGRMIVPTAPVAGVVHKIEDGWIYIRPDAAHKTAAEDDGLVKVPFQTNFPFPSKTYLHHDLSVKPGDRVVANQALGESNFTRDGVLALGKNLMVAYVPYHGLNSNDAVVISEAAAKKLTSEHMYRETYPLGLGVETDRAKHKAYFGAKHPRGAYDKLDAQGVVRKGAHVDPKDILVAGLSKVEIRGTDAMLGKLSRALATPYQDQSLLWEHGTPGEVVEVVRTGSQVTILLKTREQMQIGDKLSGRWGNKGVVSHIVPDDKMLHDVRGRPVDVLMTSAGVNSRINPAQLIETALGKVVEKTGKPIVYDNGQTHDILAWAKGVLREHGFDESGKEPLHDPISGRTLTGPDGKGILVGHQFIHKLFKSTDTNFSGHSIGPYDLNEQPLKTGGDESAKSIGTMEMHALVAHNARGILREASTIRGQRSDEFWRAMQLGMPTPTPRPSFAFRKFVAMLEGAGVKVDRRDSKFKLLPLTDADVLARSAGPIENAKTLIAKNLHPEAGGLFDAVRTGGPSGTLYSHVDLHEPIPHPVFEEPIRRLLGLTQKQFDQTVTEKGGAWFKDELGKINVPAKIAELRERIKKTSGVALNDLVKQVKYLEALHQEGLKPADAYVVSKVPVIPPVFRPMIPMPNDPTQLMVSDANKLYGKLMDANHTLRDTVLESDRGTHRSALYNTVGAVYGTHEIEDEELRGQAVKGFLTAIAGRGSPKGGFFQRKLLNKTQDVSGRGTAVPDGTLDMDEIGVPEQMLWQSLEEILVGRLVRQGYPPLDAKRLVRERGPVAKAAMTAELRERPAYFNRAPTLHRFSIVAAKVRPTQGKTIRVNSFVEKGLNLDYDGDTLQVHFPITPEAVADAKRMTLSNLLLSDQAPGKLNVFPQHEAILGTTLAAKATSGGTGPVHVFDSHAELLAAYRKGAIGLHDAAEIRSAKTAAEPEDYPPKAQRVRIPPEILLAVAPPSFVVGGEPEPEPPKTDGQAQPQRPDGRDPRPERRARPAR